MKNVEGIKQISRSVGVLGKCEICGHPGEKWIVGRNVEIVILCWEHRLQFDEAHVGSDNSVNLQRAIDYLSFLEGTLPSLNIVTISPEGFILVKQIFMDAAEDVRIKRELFWRAIRQWIEIQRELFENKEHNKHTIPTGVN